MKPLIKEIFLDMDDVLNTFTPFAMNWFDCDVGVMEYEKYDPEWGYDIVRAVNEMHAGENAWTDYDPLTFWSAVPRRLWAAVTPSDFCKELVSACNNLVGPENVCILTCPTLDPDCLAGKLEWIQEYMPENLHRNYCIAPRKRFCSSEHSLLIDDLPRNIVNFQTTYRGGIGLLVPRPWNDLRLVEPVGDYVIERLMNDYDFPIPTMVNGVRI
jgi:5'(3')-deoxyribonucleotidase